ncbi:hypothetical protein [Devosia sp. 2618]|uniref:hypothetical protein n=1 Tax=Devosia sp. 2618 TaxID=3156454 RepID=UPI0033930D49
MATEADRSRRQTIATAISAELERQGHGGAHVDVRALAQAIDVALEPAAPISEGKHPDDLNANNDG